MSARLTQSHLTQSHLTQEELTDNLSGTSSLTVNAHLLDCSTCAQELALLKSSIAGFRGAAHAWSDHALAASDRRAAPDRTLATGPFPRWFLRSRPAAGWVAVAAAMLVLIAGSTAILHRQRIASERRYPQASTPVTHSEVSQSQLEQDNQLLSQVNRELAEAVPAPMQPLLVSESGNSSAINNK